MHPETDEIHSLLGAIGREQPPADLQQRILNACRDASPVDAIECDEALELASAYLDGELHGAERDVFEAHVFACGSCYAEFKQMERTTELLRETPRAAVPAGLHERITVAIERDKHEHESVFNWRRAAKVLGGLAAAAALLAAVFVPRGTDSTTSGAPVVAEAPPEVSTSIDEPVTEPAQPTVDEPADTPEAEATTPEARVAAVPTPAREVPRTRSTTPRRSAPDTTARTAPGPAPVSTPATRPEPARETAASVPTPAPRPERTATERPQPRPTVTSERTAPQPEPEPVTAEDRPTPAPEPTRAPEVGPEPPAREPQPRETVIAATPRDPDPAPVSTSTPSPQPASTSSAPRPGSTRESERLAVVPQQPRSRAVYTPVPTPRHERSERLARIANGINGSQNPRMDNPSRGMVLN